jgi:hypothetical protein
MEPTPVLPTTWVEVLGKMEHAVEVWLPAIREAPSDSYAFSISPARPLPMPNLNGLDDATRNAEELAAEADAVLHVATADLDQWLAECRAAEQRLAVCLERAVG